MCDVVVCGIVCYFAVWWVGELFVVLIADVVDMVVGIWF